MSEIVSLNQWMKNQTALFSTRKRLLVFKDLVHTPSNEKVEEGFRYFRNPIEDVLAAFDAGDLEAFTKLTYALDDEGEPDTTSVCLLLAYTPSGSFVAAQPQEYRDYVPTYVREPRTFTSPDARRLAWSLDQSA